MSGTSLTSRVVSHATAVERDALAWGVGLRNAVGVLVPLVIGIAAGRPAAGAAAAGGAIVAGFADVGDGRRGRAETMFVASLVGGFSMFIGALVANSDALVLVATALWGFAAGLLVAVGAIEGTLGIVATLALVLTSDDPSRPSVALEIGGLALAGGLFQTLLTVLVRTRTPVHGHAASLREGRTALGAVTPGSVVGRHAIRLAAALIVATLAYRVLPIERGFWVTLTVLFVMRPDRSDTWFRIGERFVGTAIGLVLATLAVAVLEPSKLVLAIMCAVWFVPTFALLRANHLMFSIGLAAAIVSLAAVLGLPEPAAAVDRLVDVVLGLVIVAVALVAIPGAPSRPAPQEVSA